MKKAFIMIFLLLPAIFFALWIARLSLQSNRGQEIVLAIKGYDPRSMLSGHYIQYQVDWDLTPQKSIQVLNDSLKMGIKKTCNDENPPKCFFDLQKWYSVMGRFQRFYVPEIDADRLNRLLIADNGLRFDVVFAVQFGRRPVAQKLLINGIDWRQFLNEQSKEVQQ